MTIRCCAPTCAPCCAPARYRPCAGPAGGRTRQPARSWPDSRRSGRSAPPARFAPGQGRSARPARSIAARLAGHGELTDLLARALVPSPPTERQSGGYIAQGYDDALDELREIIGQCPTCHRGDGGALSRGNAIALAQDQAQWRARLFHRGAQQTCRCADGGRQRLHPPTDHGQRGALQFAHPARGSQPHCRGGRARAGGGRGAFRGTGGARCHRAKRSPPLPPHLLGSTLRRARPNAPPRETGAARRSPTIPRSRSQADATRWWKRR